MIKLQNDKTIKSSCENFGISCAVIFKQENVSTSTKISINNKIISVEVDIHLNKLKIQFSWTSNCKFIVVPEEKSIRCLKRQRHKNDQEMSS